MNVCKNPTDGCRYPNCQNCGECCGMIPASVQEVKSIREFLSKEPKVKRFAQLHSHQLLKCPFRDDDANKCLIYAARPMICRLMGVSIGMQCIHGNSAEINGYKFLEGHSLETDIILNVLDW
jgi:Fe-S-cluster containining protein